MAPNDIFSYIPVPEHPARLRQMLPTDSQDGLALLAYYRNSFVNACTREDKNTADCILDIIIHLRYRLIKLGEFLEDPASYLFAIYYEQSLPCMLYGTPLKIDFSPACDLMSLIDEIDIDEGIEIADDAVDVTFGDIDMSEFDRPAEKSAQSVETKKGNKTAKKRVKRGKVPPKNNGTNDFYPKFLDVKPLQDSEKKVPIIDSPLEHLPNLTNKMSIARNRYLMTSVSKYANGLSNKSSPEDLGDIEYDIIECLDDLAACSRGKEAVKLLEVLHPVEVVDDGTMRVSRKRTKIGYEAVDYCFRGCPSSREWLLTRQL